MKGISAGWDDTIVAPATPPGVSAISILRVSGPRALVIVNNLFPSKNLEEQPSHTLHVGFLRSGGNLIDEVVVSLFRAPRSYTGEDVVEISCHGSPFVQQQVLEACLEAGCRAARPGEFTQRAFLHGKLDLAQAEAVADLIASNTDASRKAALHQMRGGFSEELKELRERMIRFSALVELELDFSQEDVEFADRSQLKSLVEEAALTTQRLLDSFRLGNVIRSGVQAAIIGKPNAGKSTLLNALLNENRALVSEIAGTTRDSIEELINIDGILFRLIDTAGIREHTSDIIESMGMERSRSKMEQADVVIYLFDVESETPEGLAAQLKDFDARQIRYLAVGNKTDRVGEEQAKQKFATVPGIVFISAKLQQHTEVLKERLVDRVLEGKATESGTVVTNARHYHALKEVASALGDVRKGLEEHISGDLLAIDIRRCLHWLGEITGEISNEDQLDYIFSKFCIGK